MKLKIEWNKLQLDVDADVEPLIVGKHWGRPEDCTPDEGGEITINSIMLGKVDVTFLLECEHFGNEIEELCWAEVDTDDGEW